MDESECSRIQQENEMIVPEPVAQHQYFSTHMAQMDTEMKSSYMYSPAVGVGESLPAYHSQRLPKATL